MAPPSTRARTLRLLESIWRPPTGSGRRVVVLLYHAIHPDIRSPVRRRLSSQTTSHGYERTAMSFHYVRSLRSSRKKTDRPAVAITFDDGFATDHEHALPALVRQRLPATFFITTGLVEQRPPVIDRFARLLSVPRDHINGLNWGQVRELHSAGMEIGAHTVTHPNLAVLDGASATAEFRESKEQLEYHLGEPVTSFAYPFGKPKHNVTRDTVDLTRRAGFDVAVTVNFRGVRSTDRPLRIPRFAVVGDDVETLQAKVEGQMDLLGLWQEKAPRWLSHAVSPVHSHRSEGSLVV